MMLTATGKTLECLVICILALGLFALAEEFTHTNRPRQFSLAFKLAPFPLRAIAGRPPLIFERRAHALAGVSNKGRARAPRLHQAVAMQLGTAILSGDYPPGHKIGGEIDQSLSMGVSRTAYREAIRILVAKGLLESRPKAGTHVTPRSKWNLLDPDILEWMFAGRPDPQFIRNLFELRAILEPEAAALAALRRSDVQASAMDAALDLMQQHGLATSQGQDADQEFHRLLLEAAGNDALASLACSIGAAVKWTTHFKQRGNGKPRDPLAEHRAVQQAIAAGDANRARAAMNVLLANALEDMG